MKRLGSHTITVVRAGSKPADYGNGTQADWDSATSTTVDGCSVQPAPSDEFTIDRDAITTRWVAFIPWGVDIGAADRVQWSGDIYDIDGDVQRWDVGALAHIVVNLRRGADA